MDRDLNEKQEVILSQIQDLEAANERERKLQNDLKVGACVLFCCVAYLYYLLFDGL